MPLVDKFVPVIETVQETHQQSCQPGLPNHFPPIPPLYVFSDLTGSPQVIAPWLGSWQTYSPSVSHLEGLLCDALF